MYHIDEDGIIDLTVNRSHETLNHSSDNRDDEEMSQLDPTDQHNQSDETIQLTQLSQKTLIQLRESLIDECDEICPILQKKIPRGKFVLDHQHKTSKEEIGSNGGAGLCRGVMDFRCNALEGKITNSFKRLGLNKEIELPFLLRNLADYLERPNLPFIHPKEKPKKQKLMKSSYNKLVTTLQNNNYTKPIPKYPPSGTLTKNLKNLYKIANLEPVLK